MVQSVPPYFTVHVYCIFWSSAFHLFFVKKQLLKIVPSYFTVHTYISWSLSVSYFPCQITTWYIVPPYCTYSSWSLSYLLCQITICSNDPSYWTYIFWSLSSILYQINICFKIVFPLHVITKNIFHINSESHHTWFVSL